MKRLISVVKFRGKKFFSLNILICNKHILFFKYKNIVIHPLLYSERNSKYSVLKGKPIYVTKNSIISIDINYGLLVFLVGLMTILAHILFTNYMYRESIKELERRL